MCGYFVKRKKNTHLNIDGRFPSFTQYFFFFFFHKLIAVLYGFRFVFTGTEESMKNHLIQLFVVSSIHASVIYFGQKWKNTREQDWTYKLYSIRMLFICEAICMYASHIKVFDCCPILFMLAGLTIC